MNQDISNQLTPPSSNYSHENKGGGQLLGVNWDFKSYFLSELKQQDLVQKSLEKEPQKKFRRFAAIFLPKNTLKIFSPLRGDLP